MDPQPSRESIVAAWQAAIEYRVAGETLLRDGEALKTRAQRARELAEMMAEAARPQRRRKSAR